MNRIFRYLSVLMICLSFSISSSAAVKTFLRDGYYYSAEDNSSVVMGYHVSQVSREESEKNKNWYCVEGIWYEDGLRIVVKDLDVYQPSDYAKVLVATGEQLTSITSYYVPGLKSARLGHDNENYSKCTIKSNAFKDCSSLNSISIDKSIGTIESQAFYGVTEGTIVFNEMKPPTLKPDAFCEEAYNNVLLVIPDTKIPLFKDSNWNSFKNIIPSSQYYIKFSESSYTLQIGTSITLSFTNDADVSELKWTSSDPTIAEVDNGVVTGINQGKVTITATNKYGNSSSCVVNVLPEVESLEITSIDGGIIKDGTLVLDLNSSFDLNNIKIKISPNNAYDKTLSYSCDNPELAYITDNILYTTGSGFTTLTVTAMSGVSVTIPIYVKYGAEFAYNGILYHKNEYSKICVVMGLAQQNERDLIIPSELELFEGTYRVTYIYENAFKNSNITSVFIPNSVTTIGEYAFSGCKGLGAVEIEDGETALNFDSYVFDGSAISTLYLGRPFKYKNIYLLSGGGLFADQPLSDLIISNKVTSIENWTFIRCANLKSVEIPNSVTNIGEYAFSECTSLSSVEIPNSVTIIGQHAFSECSSLSSVKIPTSVTTINQYTFSECTSLSSVEIPNSVTTIGQYAFSKCSNLSSVEIPNSVTTIGEYTFSKCSSLSSVEIPNSVTTIGEYTFN